MPSFACSSSLRVASQDHVLRLKITHTLVHGPPSDVVHSVKRRLPRELDVLWLSDIAIALSGSLDGRQATAPEIVRSGLARHLRMQLNANADGLGLNNVSHPFVDDTDGLVKVMLTPSRPLPAASRPHANLVCLHLAYIWGTIAGRSNSLDPDDTVETVDPFSPALLLPTEALLNRVTEQLLICHVVGRYPLIFGPWCKRLDLEKQYFPSIGQSMLQIVTRSRNNWFLSKCQRLLKIARRQHKCVIQTSAAALCACTGDDSASDSEGGIDNLCATPVLTDLDVLCESLEQLFRTGVPQWRFKPAVTPQLKAMSPEEDDSLLLSICDTATDDWVALSDIGTPSCVLQSDLDIFAVKDEDMWQLDEVDTGRGADTRSDKSLISASISLASIATGSPETCSIAPCEHPGMVYHETARGLYVNRLESHAQHDEQLVEEMETWEEGFERLDSGSEGGLEEDWPGVAEL